MVLVFIIATASGCATTEKSSWDPFQLVYPRPPERPRIKYVASYATSEDIEPSSGLAATMFGDVNPERLLKPFGVTTDEAGRVYVSDIARIFVFDRANKKLSFIGEYEETKLGRPTGLFYDKQSRLIYVADVRFDRVRAYTTDGSLVFELGRNGELKDPGGVVVDAERNRVYVTNTKHHVISIFDTKGNFIRNMGKRGGAPGEFNFPTQIAIDGVGNIYVVDSGNFRVQVIDPEGTVKKHMGEVGTLMGQFARPKGIAVSREGYIFVIDSTHDGVTMFDSYGRLLLTWGQSGLDKGLFQLPAGIHVDEKGLVYIINQYTARMDIFQFITYPDDKEMPPPGEEKKK